MSYYSELAYEEWEQANLYGEEEPDQKETAEEPNEPAPIPQPAEPKPQPVPAPAPVPDPAPAQGDDESAKRKAHEAAEAKRKAEWDAAQEQKRAEEQDQLDRIAHMDENALRLEAIQRVSLETDKMTNRSMKDSVSAHIQSVCEKDLSFARLAMHPKKSMLQYIFRHAKDYLQKELEAGGIKISGMCGGDVPDGLCYQWAEDYFRDPDAAEDKDTEQFTPRPYISRNSAVKKPAPKPKGFVDGQISLLGEAG